MHLTPATSFVLNALRAGAAQAVCVGHALSLFGVYRPDASMQSVAVLVFFLLSGFLIAGALHRNADAGLGSYLTQRFARIYSAYLPALVLIFLIEALLMLAGRHPTPTSFNADVLLGNLVMLQGWPAEWGSYLAVNNPGSSGQLWTIAVEWHLYMFAGGAYFLLRGNLWGAVMMAVFYVWPLHLLGSPKDGMGAGLSLLWAAGFGLFFIADLAGKRCATLSFRTLLVGAAVAFAAYVVMINLKGGAYCEYSITAYPFIVAAFALLLLATQRLPSPMQESAVTRIVRFAADYSFSLYLLHLAVLWAVRVSGFDPWSGVVVGVVIANLLSAGFAYLTERHYRAVGDFLLARLRHRSQAEAAQ